MIGQLIVNLTPADNLDVGSFELIYTIDLNKGMFSKPKMKPNELSVTDEAQVAVCMPLPPLMSPNTKLQVAIQMSTPLVLDGNTSMAIVLTRDGEVLYSKSLVSEGQTQLSSVTYGSNTGNPVVNLSQDGDVYQIRISHR